MVEESRGPRDLLPLTPAVLHILLALADEERHGYGIMREVEERTGGRRGWVREHYTARSSACSRMGS